MTDSDVTKIVVAVAALTAQVKAHLEVCERDRLTLTRAAEKAQDDIDDLQLWRANIQGKIVGAAAAGGALGSLVIILLLRVAGIG